MNIQTKYGETLSVCPFHTGMTDLLVSYLHSLSTGSKSRFGPHPFTREAVELVFSNPDLHQGFVAINPANNQIIAYSLIYNGIINWDLGRLQSYGILPDSAIDCTYAPSVADLWQSRGVGQLLFFHMKKELFQQGKRRIILWGGVQATNDKAVAFYLKNGFRVLGEFEHNGRNLDMILDRINIDP